MTAPDEGFPPCDIPALYASTKPHAVAVRCGAERLTWQELLITAPLHHNAPFGTACHGKMRRSALRAARMKGVAT